jgi:LAGLIDADG endonuclease
LLQNNISECIYVVSKFEDIKILIIPIFKFTNLYTSKAKDFKDFCLAFDLKDKFGSSLTTAQFNSILKIKFKMNVFRKHRILKNLEVIKSKPLSDIPNLNYFWILGFFEREGSFFN